MSRYHLQSMKPGNKVVVGWDPPLRTFFAQVIGPEGEESEDGPILWVGTRQDEIWDIDVLERLVQPHAHIPYRIKTQLLADSD